MFDLGEIEPWLMRMLVARLEFVMSQLAQALPMQTPSDIDTLFPEDLRQIWEWNESVPAPVEKCIQRDNNLVMIFRT